MEEKKIKFHDKEYTLPILEEINLKEFDKKVKEIDEIVACLYDYIDPEKQKELDYAMYEYGREKADQQRVLIRNKHKLGSFQTKLFSENRRHYTSDLTARKAVNIATKEQQSLLDTQGECMDWLDTNYWLFKDIAESIKSRRIGELADAKRNVL